MGIFGAKEQTRARFYDDLATSLDAGLGASESLRGVAPGLGRVGSAALGLEARIVEGRTIGESMEDDPEAWSVFERRVIEAGDRGGRLPATMRRLAQHFERAGAAKDRVGYGLLYPVALMHAVFLLPPLKYLIVEGNPIAYARAALVPIAMLWAIGAGFVLVVRSMRATEPGRKTVDTTLLALPIVGGTARSVATLEYATTLGALFAAGIPATEAMEQAAAATRNAVFADAGRRAAERLRHGDKMHEALASERGVFPSLLIDAVRIGETTGKMDETLERIERSLREEVDRKIKAISIAVPAIMYGLVMLYIAWTIISFYTGYFRQIDDLMR